jgi:hypothetical protein
MLAGKLDDLAIAVGGLLFWPRARTDHTQAIIAFMYFRIAFQQVARSGFRLIELALASTTALESRVSSSSSSIW